MQALGLPGGKEARHGLAELPGKRTGRAGFAFVDLRAFRMEFR
jgi:hypothetical protein